MFKTALNKTIIPHTWKLANIVPIPKPNKDTDKGISYRPISLLSVIAKTLEKSLLPYTTANISNYLYHYPFFFKLYASLSYLFLFILYASLSYAFPSYSMLHFHILFSSYSMLHFHTLNTNNSTCITITATTAHTT